MQSVTPPPFPKIKLKELNMHLKCILCGGYYIDATTIIECLHSFCKTCIVKYLETHKFCPICDVQIHKTRPLINIRSDQTLQDIVYKAVPGLFKTEMKRRREFYSKHPDALINGTGVPICSEGRGEVLGGERLIFTPEDYINISMESCPPHIPFPPHGNLISTFNNWPGSNRRYFRCPGSLTVAHLKKLLRNKYGLNSNCKIDVSYVHDILDESYTMIDLAYIYSWRRNGDLRLFYQTEQDLLMKRRRIEAPSTDLPLESSKKVSNSSDADSSLLEKNQEQRNGKIFENVNIELEEVGNSLVNGEEHNQEEVRTIDEKHDKSEESDKVVEKHVKCVSQKEGEHQKSSEEKNQESSSDDVKMKEALEKERKQTESPNSGSKQNIYEPSNLKNTNSNGPLVAKFNGHMIDNALSRPLTVPSKEKNNSAGSTNKPVGNNAPPRVPVPEHYQQMLLTNSSTTAHYHQQLHQHLQQQQQQLQLQQDRNRLSPINAKFSTNDQRNIQICPNTTPMNLQMSPQNATGLPLHSLPHFPPPTGSRGMTKTPRARKPTQRRRTVRQLQGQGGGTTVHQQLQHQQQKQQQQQQQLHAQQHFHSMMVHNAQMQAMLTGQYFNQARIPLPPFRHGDHLNLSVAQNITDNLQQRLAAAYNQSECHPSPPRIGGNEPGNSVRQSPTTVTSGANSTVIGMKTTQNSSSMASPTFKDSKPFPNVTVPFTKAVPNHSTSLQVCLTSTPTTTSASNINSINNNNTNKNGNSNLSASNKNNEPDSKSPTPMSRVANYLAKWLPECEPTSPEAYDIPNPLNATSSSNSNNNSSSIEKSQDNSETLAKSDSSSLPKSKS